MYANRRNFRVLSEIGAEEHDGDVRCQTGSGNIAISFMRHASGHNYRKSSFINCERGYGADTTFHRTYFQQFKKTSCNVNCRNRAIRSATYTRDFTCHCNSHHNIYLVHLLLLPSLSDVPKEQSMLQEKLVLYLFLFQQHDNESLVQSVMEYTV